MAGKLCTAHLICGNIVLSQRLTDPILTDVVTCVTPVQGGILTDYKPIVTHYLKYNGSTDHYLQPFFINEYQNELKVIIRRKLPYATIVDTNVYTLLLPYILYLLLFILYIFYYMVNQLDVYERA